MNQIISIIDQQLEAYNRHDLEGFVACYAPDAELINLADGSLIAAGSDQIRAMYRQPFEIPGLHADIINRMVLGDFVIDFENGRGIPGVELVEAIVIYQMKEGLIAKAWIIRKE